MKRVVLFTLRLGFLSVWTDATDLKAAGPQVLHGHVPSSVQKSRFVPLRSLSSSARLNLAIGLPLRDPDGLSQFINSLYDPASPNFHQYLTTEQFTERFGPTEQDYQAVVAFAESHGLHVIARHPNRIVLDVNGTVGDIEKALHLKLQVYQHPSEARTFYAPDTEPQLELSIPVLHIGGLDTFSLPRPRLHRASPHSESNDVIPKTGSGQSGSYMGDDFRAAYVPGTTLRGSGQSVGLLQFDGFYAADITTFETQAGRTNTPLFVVPIDGGVSNPGSGNIEVALDIEMVISMAPGISSIYVYEAPNPSPWEDLLSRMANDNLAKQLSCSWGDSSPSQNATAETIFQQMAAQGQSFFNASGDSDAFVGGIPFPSDSTNITQVGGTTLTTTGPGGAWLSESVWNKGRGTGSSGGVSGYYQIPVWQQGISMTANQGSTIMRNVPDVALIGNNVYIVADNGTPEPGVSGTSCSAPLWAGFMALVNQQAAISGRPPAGFINPAIYAIGQGPIYGSVFHDIAIGNNTWSSSPSQFYAVAGYDLCSGWGTPAGSALINALAPPINAPYITIPGASLVSEGCLPTNGVIDPGEAVSVSFTLQNSGNLNTSNLVAILLTTNGVVLPSAAQNYGTLVAGGAAVSRNFSFTANAPCGAMISPVLQLQNAGTNLGAVTYSFTLGKMSVATAFSENFDGVSKPLLPSGWAIATSGGASNWVTSSASSDSSPYSAHEAESFYPGIGELISPSIAAPSAAAQLTFRQSYNIEGDSYDSTVAYDGGVLEIQTNGGSYYDILAVGGSFATGGYTRTIDPTDDNPLGGRQCWSGNSGGWMTTTVNLPPQIAGQSIRFKWRFATDTDNYYSVSGWSIDTVSISYPHFACCMGRPFIASVRPTHTNFGVNINTVTGVTYTLEYKNRLTDTQWIGLAPSISGTGGSLWLQDTNAPAPSRFYRVRSN